MRTRRGFLGLGAGALFVATFPVPAIAADDAWVVSYLWSRTLSRVVAHRKVVADTLGPELGSRLIVVSNPQGHWGLLDERPGTDHAAVTVQAAERHARLVAVVGGTDKLAAAMPNRDYTRTHHVAYGLFSTEAEAVTRRELVSRLLGPEVSAALAVDAVGGHWQPVYHRFGDAAGTEQVAASHTKLLARRGVTVSVVPDRYYDPRWAVAPTTEAVAKSGRPPKIEGPPKIEEPPPEVVAKVEVPPEPKVEVPAKAEVAKVEVVDPLDLPATSTTPLRDAINAHVQGLRRQGIIDDDETTSWYVQTLHDDRTWAAINAERSLQCASMVKPYVALAFLHRVKEGRIVYGDLSRTKLESMIQYSNNASTNWAMETLGGPASVQKILTQHYGHLVRETSITELIPKNGRTYENRSSARDYVRFSRALYRHELPMSQELERLMGLPGRDRLYTGAPSIPKCTQVMNKTGTTAQLVGDFGILVAQTRAGKKVPYAIVGIIEKSCSATSYSTWVASRTRVIRGVSNLAYESLKAQYDLV